MLCKKRRYKQKRFWVFKTWRIATKKSYK
jgi:hypothetical protein